MDSVNVLFLHKWFSLSGGVERVHKNLATALADKGVKSAFYVQDTQGNKQQGYDKLTAEFPAFSPDQNAGKIEKITHLFKHIEEGNVSVIISATETANMLAMLCALKFPHLKIIYTRHCAFDVSDQKLPAWLIKLLYNFYALTNNTIVTVSESLTNELKKVVRVGKSSIQFIPNAVVNSRIRHLATRNTDDFTEQRYFCAVGRLVEQKGFDMLLQAYAKAYLVDPDIPRLVIVGTGDDKSALQRLATELNIAAQVVFYGFTDNPYYIINHAEAFVLSSRHEGMPTALVEAMFLDTPVIAFDCPTGPGELIKNTVNGLLVPANDIDELALAMRNYQSINNKQISHSVAHFQYENVAQQYMAHF